MLTGTTLAVLVSSTTLSLVFGNSAQAQGLPYGPDTCRQGYVWREAVPNDHVCVTPQTRSQAAIDNSQASNRRVSSGVIIDYGTQLNPVHD